MKEQLMQYWQPIEEYWKALPQKTKKIIGISTIGCILFSVALVLLLSRKSYTTLYTNISNTETSEVMSKLETMGVEYRVNNGLIEVKTEQSDQIKMKLAIDGYPKSGLSYDIFTGNIDLMSTDFEKNTFKIYQLQERLRDTIKLINGVEDAVVTIAIPQQSNYIWKDDRELTTASVVLQTTSQNAVSSSGISGIAQLVAKSIPGLDIENVAIVDTYGNDLINNVTPQNEVNVSKLKMDIEKQVESSTKNKVLELLVPIYGEKNINATVKCVVDLDKKITEHIEYIPNKDTDRGVIEKEEINKESTTQTNQESNVPGTESNTQVPEYPSVNPEGDKIYVKDQSSYQYLVSSIKEQIQSETPQQKEMTIAVAINKASLSQEERENIQNLVAAAGAISPDKVVIHNAVFEGQGKIFLGNDNTTTLEMKIAILASIIFIALLIIFMLVRRSIKRNKQIKAEKEKLQSNGITAIAQNFQSEMQIQEKLNNLQNLDNLAPTDGQQLQQKIQELSDKNPELVAKLIRSWLKGDENKIGK